MKKKKKFDNSSNDINFYNIFENFINIEDKINYQNSKIMTLENNINIKSKTNQVNLSLIIEENYNVLFKKLTVNQKKSYNFLNKILNNDESNKYNFIRFFNNKNKVMEQLNNKINTYQKTFNNLVDDNINLSYFIGLIKDDKCVPFWNDKIKEISKNIFLPIKENLKKLKNPKTFNYDNWFSTKHYINNNLNDELYEIIIKKERQFNNTYIDKKTGKTKNIIKCKKVKMYLDNEQKIYLTRLFGAYRYYYNRTIQFINNYNKTTKKTFFYVNYNDDKTIKNIDLKDEKNLFTLMTMRKYLKEDEPEWMKDLRIYSHLIDKAIDEASDNYNKCMSKFKKSGIPFTLSVKNKKIKFQTMNLETSMFDIETKTLFNRIRTKNNKVKSLFGNLKLSENISKLDICDFSITCNTKLNKYFININYHDNKIKDKETLKNKKVCSIDPGLKTYLTLYSDNKVEELGIGITTKLNKVCKEVDIINSKMNKKKEENNKEYNLCNNKRRNLKRALHRKIEYLENLKSELHNKCINHLIKSYGKIVLPKLETQEMAGKFNSKLSIALYNLSNYKFMEKLKIKSKEHDIELVIRPEYYTSKTCSRCGWLNNNLKLTDRIYKCLECELCIDRDINASRNIMLRNNEWELPPLHHS